MGRPLNKKYFGDAVDSIKVSNYYLAQGLGEEAGGDDTYIVSQRSTRKFLVADTSGAWSEILTLVDKDADTLSPGEFRIDGVDADGNAYNVVRLYNRTLRLGNATDTFVKEKWSVEGGPSADLVITGITRADPAVITVASTATITDGETVTIDGGDMVDIDGTYVATVIDGTTFSVPVNSTGFTLYTTGGVVTGVGEGGLDVQAS